MDWPLHDKQNLKASIQVLKVFLNNFKSNEYKEEDLYANIRKTFKDFTRPPHRYEFVSSFTGIDFINDSKSTNLDSMLMAVRSVHHNKQKGEIYLICGGDSKGQDFIKTDLSELKNVKNIFIYGKDKKIIFNSVQKYSNCKSVIDLETAFKTTLSMAKKGDTVLFSPACSSLDMFKDYQERGNRFKSLVKDL
jgi:UDP-N-acetylmuramoylalanine--D-glutamate ligase